MFPTLIIASIYVSFNDWREHRVTNKSLIALLVIFASLSFLNGFHHHPKGALVALALGLIGYRYGLGAGDVKLAVVLSLFFAPSSYSEFVDWLNGFIAISLLSLLAHRLQDRVMQSSIALGPAICGAFIWCAR